MLVPILVFAGLSGQADAQDPRVSFDTGWELSGDGTRVEDHRGARALRMRTGRAIRRDVSFQDGTIEFDLAVTSHRSFAYLQFRMVADGEHEEVYFRPHKSRLPDAIQYNPVWQGEGTWQLYHGPGATAPVTFTHGEWMRVRLVLRGRRAALFIGRTPAPTLVMRLAREPRAGFLAFRSFVPAAGAPEGLATAAFANLSVRPGYFPYDFGPEPPPDAPASGIVTRWQLSPAFAAGPGPVTELQSNLLASKLRWPAFPTEPSGLLVIGRYLARPAPLSAAVARLVLRTSQEGPHPLRLGYSDYVTVYLNGRPLFAGDARYSYDNPRQEGLIGLSQATVWLPLVEGENELLLAVADGFGGWGLMAQLDSAAGVQVVRPPSDPELPVTPELFIGRFRASEGITFNAEGRLFIGAERGIWIAEPDGSARRIADVDLHLGQAGIGPRDILAADFGPTNVFQHGENSDGVVWRVTPDGRKTVVARGIADPNAIVVLPDRTLLVSDDGTDKIYRVRGDSVAIWSTAVAYPNGMVLSLGDSVLYVAQIFRQLNPIVPDDRIWAFRLVGSDPVGPPRLVGRTGEGGVDGLALDEFGRIYIADNGAGKVWRMDPVSGRVTLIAEGMPGVASLVFGEGRFDREALYATSTQRGGGRIWKIRVGVRGAPLHR